MTRHPAVEQFRALLRQEGGAWAEAKRSAFDRICEAFTDEEGLPPASGLRQIERGHFNSRLEGPWKPIFIDSYRQWLGFRMELDFQRPAERLSLAWWFTAPAMARRAGGIVALRLLTPATALAAALALLTLLALGPALAARADDRKLSRALASLQAEQEHVVKVEMSAMSWIDTGSDSAIETLLGHTPTLRQAEASVKAERKALAKLLASMD